MQKYKLDLDEIIQDCERFAVKVEKGEGLHGMTMNGEEFDVTEVMENCMDECKDCEKAPSHVSKCTSETGYCKYFPYEMPDYYGQREDLKEDCSRHKCRERRSSRTLTTTLNNR